MTAAATVTGGPCPAETSVSVIIPTKNRSALLRQAIESVAALQGADLRLEIIVADNGSTDDTEAVAAELGARFVSTAVPGAAAARNAGLRAATGEFVAFLDDDDVWLPGHLRSHIALMRAEPEIAAVIGQVQVSDADLRPRSAPYPLEMPADGRYFRAFLGEYPQIGATLARASVRDTVGYFDEALLGDQDWDWHLRLARTHRLGFAAVPSMLFRQREAGRDDDLVWRRMSFQNRVYFGNIRSAGKQRPSPWFVVRNYVRHQGEFYRYFADSAVAHRAAGNPGATRRSLLRALRTSPPHLLRDIAQRPDVRSALRSLLPL